MSYHLECRLHSRMLIEGDIRMKLFSTLSAGVLALGLTMVPGFAQSAKEDMKDAGHDVKDAAKSTGRATKKAAKKSVNKAADKTAQGDEKVADKTDDKK